MPADAPAPIVPDPDDMPRRPRRRGTWLWLLVGALVVAGAGAWYRQDRAASDAAAIGLIGSKL